MRSGWNTPSRRMEFYAVAALAVAVVGLSHSLGYWPFGIAAKEPSETIPNEDSWLNREDIWRAVFVLALIAVGWLYYIGRKAGRVLVNSGLSEVPKLEGEGGGKSALENLSSGLPFDAPRVTLPDGREVVTCTQDDLRALYRANTVERTSRALKGKWIRMSGELREHSDNQLYLKVTDKPLIMLKFAKGWDEELLRLQRGSQFTFRGKIVAVDIYGLSLEECEFL